MDSLINHPFSLSNSELHVDWFQEAQGTKASMGPYQQLLAKEQGQQSEGGMGYGKCVHQQLGRTHLYGFCRE
jgi:hypothetical protein